MKNHFAAPALPLQTAHFNIFRHGIYLFAFALCVFSAMTAQARILGFEDFDGGGYGWNWDNSVQGAPVQDGNASSWFVSATDNVPNPYTLNIVNGAAQVTNTKIFRTYHDGTITGGSDAAPTGERLGAIRSTYGERGIIQFDMAISNLSTGHAGMSFYDFGAERLFFGVTGSQTFGISTNGIHLSDPITAEEGKTYRVVGLWGYTPNDMYMWVFDGDYQPQYSDLFQPYAQRTAALTNWNSRIAMNVGGTHTAAFDNITVATEFTDIFGQPNVSQIRESFSGYDDSISLTGQMYRNVGQKPLGTWATGAAPANAATVNNSNNLAYGAAATSTAGKDTEGLWAGDGGSIRINNTSARMEIDTAVFGQWNLLDANGVVGGSDVDGVLYYGFLLQYNGDPATGSANWSGGAQLFNGGNEILGLTKHGSGEFYSGFASGTNFVFNSENGTGGEAGERVDDNDVHLVIARLDFNANSADNLTVWFDPDLTKSMQTQNAALTTNFTKNDLSLAFNSITFRGGSDYNYDEWRMATSWNDLTGYSEAAPTSLRENFSGYTAGAIGGQNYLKSGEAVGGQWDGAAQIVSDKNLVYAKGGWESKQGLLSVNNNNATLKLDTRLMDEWGLLSADGKVGGAGVSGDLYYGFLLQADASVWAGGAELFNGNTEVLGLGQYSTAGGFFSGFSNVGLGDFDFLTADADAKIALDDDVHLVLAKISYDDLTGLDSLTVWFDPDLGVFEDPSAVVHEWEGTASLAFDSIIFRNGGSDWLYDEFRMANSWGALTQEVPEPATWVMLLLGGAAVLAMRVRRKQG